MDDANATKTIRQPVVTLSCGDRAGLAGRLSRAELVVRMGVGLAERTNFNAPGLLADRRADGTSTGTWRVDRRLYLMASERS